jgi:hypothetical protein
MIPSYKRSETPERPITFRTAEDLGAFDLDVLGCYGTSPFRMLRSVMSPYCLSGCARTFTCRHARETDDETIRETVTHREAPRWDRAPAPPADLFAWPAWTS